MTTPTTPKPGFLSKLGTIEFLEMLGLGLLVSLFSSLNATEPIGPSNVLAGWVFIQGAILLAWGSYNLFIRLARAGGSKVDVGLWIIATAATASATFWIWTVLDINRLIVSKIFYRGAAPVEYAWSSKSKLRRKEWEAANH